MAYLGVRWWETSICVWELQGRWEAGKVRVVTVEVYGRVVCLCAHRWNWECVGGLGWAGWVRGDLGGWVGGG